MFVTNADNSKTRRLVSLEMQIVASEDQALQPVGLEKHVTR
jgi:hypothetical protein